MNNQPYVIGRISVDIDDDHQNVILEVYNDGTVYLPDGTPQKVDDATLEVLMDEYKKEETTNKHGEQTPEFERKILTQYDPDTIALKKAEREARQKKEKRQKLVIGILVTLLTVLVLGISGFLLYTNWPAISGQITGNYSICVVNHDIKKGDVIQDSDLSFQTVTTDVYTSMLGKTYLTDAGKMADDTPLFFTNRAECVGKYTTEDLNAGTSVMKSSYTAITTSSDTYVVTTEDENGNPTQSIVDGDYSGDVTIDYVAVVTLDDGSKYQVNLSSVKLRNKTLQDIISGSTGESILQNYTPMGED